MLGELLTDGQRLQFSEQHELDFSLDVPGVARFRVNLFQQQRGEAAVFRLIPSTIKSLDDLGMPVVLKDLCLRDWDARGHARRPQPHPRGQDLSASLDHPDREQGRHAELDQSLTCRRGPPGTDRQGGPAVGGDCTGVGPGIAKLWQVQGNFAGTPARWACCVFGAPRFGPALQSV